MGATAAAHPAAVTQRRTRLLLGPLCLWEAWQPLPFAWMQILLAAGPPIIGWLRLTLKCSRKPSFRVQAWSSSLWCYGEVEHLGSGGGIEMRGGACSLSLSLFLFPLPPSSLAVLRRIVFLPTLPPWCSTKMSNVAGTHSQTNRDSTAVCPVTPC